MPTISPGRPEESVAQTHLTAIHDAKEQLKRENDALKLIKQRLRETQDRIKTEKEVSGG